MADQVLSWAVVILPTLFALGIEVISKEIKAHPYWRVGVITFGIGLSAPTWLQMSRANRAAVTDRQNAIVETSQRVSADVSAAVSERVTKAVTEQYQTVVADQKKQISELQSQIAAQGKKVDVISGSNIVTGKKPVRVEVVNPEGTTLPQTRDLKVVSVRDVSSPYTDAPFGLELAIQTTVPLQPILLNIVCSEPVSYVESYPSADFTGQVEGGANPAKEDPHIAVVSMKSPAFTPQHAMIVKIFSATRNHVISFKYNAGSP